MADAHDSATPCIPGCLLDGGRVLSPWLTRLQPQDGLAHDLLPLTSRALAVPLVVAGDPVVTDGCTAPGPPRAWIWRETSSGALTGLSLGANGSLGWGGGGFAGLRIDLRCPMDVVADFNSLQGANEAVFLTDGADEAYPGSAGTFTIVIPSGGNNSQEDLPPGVRYKDNTPFVPGVFVWRGNLAPKVIRFQVNGQAGLGAGGDLYAHLHDASLVNQRCEPFAVRACTPVTTPRWRPACAATTAAVSTGALGWADGGGAAPWEVSVNSGGSWSPSAGAVAIPVATPAGTYRWRQVWTVPPGYHGYVMWLMRTTPATVDGTMLLDGAPAADNFKAGGVPAVTAGPGWSSGWVALSPGAHTFEHQAGAAVAGTTFVPNVLLRTSGMRRDRADIDVTECLDVTGAVVTTSLADAATGSPYVLPGYATMAPGRCTGCET